MYIDNTKKRWVIDICVLALLPIILITLKTRYEIQTIKAFKYFFISIFILFSIRGIPLVLKRFTKNNIFTYLLTYSLTYRAFCFWTDRLFILCVAFLPLIYTNYRFIYKLNEVNAKANNNNIFLSWPFSTNAFVVDWGLITYFILTGCGLYVLEKIFESESFRLKRPAQLFVLTNQIISQAVISILGLVLIGICIYCLLWLNKIKISEYEVEIASSIIAYLFYYISSLFLPLILFIPASLIIFKTSGGGGHHIHCFYNFYKIFLKEHPITISFGVILIVVQIGILFHSNDGNKGEITRYSARIQPELPIENRDNRLWKLEISEEKERSQQLYSSFIIIRILVPLVLFLTPFAVVIKNFDRLFEADFHDKLCHIISSMQKHTIILGYGYLGKDILKEIKERRIISDKEVIVTLTPTLKKIYILKNLLIIDKEPGIFNHIISDSIYGDIGIIESEGERTDPDFYSEEFRFPLSLNKLCKAIYSDNYGIELRNPPHKEDWLNALLKKPGFYAEVYMKKRLKNFPEKISLLISKTGAYRGKNYEKLSKNEQDNIRWLNRLLLEYIYPGKCPSRNKEPEYIAGIIGDGINKSTLERANINDSYLFISAMSDHDATSKLVEFISDKKCNCIITVQNYYQLKMLLPCLEDRNSAPLILLYPSYMEGVTLGRTVFMAATPKIIEKIEKKEIPKIVIIGSGKQIYYLVETYILGLKQILHLELNSLGDLEIYMLSNDEFFVKRSTVNETLYNRLGIEKEKTRTWNGFVNIPNNNKNYTSISCNVIVGEPDYSQYIQTILDKIKPPIIVVSHKRADRVLKILDSLITNITDFRISTYKPKILVGTKGKEKQVEDYLLKYKNTMKINDPCFPIQEFDARVRVYDDAREQIGGISEALFAYNKRIRSENPVKEYNKPVCLYFCVKNEYGTLAKLCNKLAGLEPYALDSNTKIQTKKRPSFLNLRVYNCPGNNREPTNSRFLIESDVILEDVHTHDNKNCDGDFFCKGLILPMSQREIVNKILDNGEHPCLDNDCTYRGLYKCSDTINCNSRNNSNGTHCASTNESPVDYSQGIPIAKLFLCSNSYDIPGTVGHALNNLLFLGTRIRDSLYNGNNQTAKVVDLTYTKSYYCFDQNMHKKEFYGNIVTIEKAKDNRSTLFKNTFISEISICPITCKEEWMKYSNNLTQFLNSQRRDNNPYEIENRDAFNIQITDSKRHESNCPGTCHVAKRKKCIVTDGH